MRLLQIVLTIISLKHPDQTEKVSTEANLPLLGFKTPDEVVSYIDAVIRSGTSADEKSGTVFLMGNTAHHVSSCSRFETTPESWQVQVFALGMECSIY